MRFRDFSPPSIPTLDEQRDALQKGLGRAMQWARAGRLSKDVLLEACLHTQVFDLQCEPGRGEWLWTLMEALGVRDGLRSSILRAFRNQTVECDSHQLCDLAFRFAKFGDREFDDALHQFVTDRPFPESDSIIGQDELVKLHSEQAWLFIAGVRGKWLEHRPWEWEDRWFAETAERELGRDRFDQLLTASTDPAILRFSEQMKANPEPEHSEPRISRIERLRDLSASAIITTARAGGSPADFRGWGMNAAPEQLREVWNSLSNTDDPEVVVRLLRVFSNRALPQFDAKLIDLCLHDHEPVRRWAFAALSKNSHPQVRQFAVERIRQGDADRFEVQLLTQNFTAGDERLILDHVELPVDPDELHWLLNELIDILKENRDADASVLGLIIYAETPCTNCRGEVVKVLVRNKVAPDWLLEECRDDSEEVCRKTVREQNTPPEGQQSA